MKYISLLYFLNIFTLNVIAQYGIVWSDVYGTDKYELPSSLVYRDGKVSILGSVLNNGYCIGKDGTAIEVDYRIADSTYNVQCIGGTSVEFGVSLYTSTDLIFKLINSTSNDGDLTGLQHNGDFDIWLEVYDTNSVKIFSRLLGGSGDDAAYSILLTKDSSILISGMSVSDDIIFNNNKGSFDAILLKLDLSGNLLWSKNYGSTEHDCFHSVIEYSNGYLACGESYGNDGDIQSSILSAAGGWVVKLDKDGNLVKEVSLNHIGISNVKQLVRISDSRFWVMGTSSDSAVNHISYKGALDIAVCELDTNLDVIQIHFFGGSQNDIGKKMWEISNGFWAIGGLTHSNDGDILFNHGYIDYWIFAFDIYGNVIFSQTFGGSDHDELMDVFVPNNSNSIFVTGISKSDDGMVSENNGDFDIWTLQLYAEFLLEQKENSYISFTGDIFPNPSEGYFNFDLHTIPIHIDYSISLFDLMGRMVISDVQYRIIDSLICINLVDVLPGVYMLHINDCSVSKIFKVYVQ